MKKHARATWLASFAGASAMMLCGLHAPLRAQTITWNGPENGDWHTDANWSGGAAPTSASTVRINSVNGPLLDSGTAYSAAIDIAQSGSGLLTMGGDAVLLTDSSFQGQIGAAANTFGLVVMSGSSYWENGGVYLGLGGTGQLDMTDSAHLEATAFISLGRNASGRGTINMYGSSSLNVVNAIFVGDGVNASGGAVVGVLNMYDSSYSYNTNDVIVGRQAASTGTIRLFGSATMDIGRSLITGSAFNGTIVLSDSSLLHAGSRTTGTVTIGDGPSSSGSIIVRDNATLRLSRAGPFYVGLGGNGALTLEDGGFVMAPSMTIASNATSSGTLVITGATAGRISGTNGVSAITITGGAGSASVIFSHSDSAYTFANNLAGSLSVLHSGAGRTVLTGNNNHTGGTVVDAGSLLLGGGALAGSVNVAAGATFGGAGTASGGITLAAGSTLRAGLAHSGPGTLGITGNLTLNAGAILEFGLYGGTDSDLLSVGGVFTIPVSGAISLASVITGTYHLVSTTPALDYAAITSLSLVADGAPLASRANASFLPPSGNDLYLSILVSNTNLSWTGNTSSGWNFGADSNWSLGDTRFLAGDSITFDDSAPAASRNVAVGPGGVQAAGMIVDTGGVYAFSGDGILAITTSTFDTTVAAPTGKLSKHGAGTLDFTGLAGANNFQEGLDILNGAIAISSAAQLGVPLQKLAFLGDDSTATTRVLINGAVAIDGLAGGSGAQQLAIAPGNAGGFLLANGSTLAISNNANAATGAITIAPGAAFTIAPQSPGAAATAVFNANTASNGGALHNQGVSNLTDATFTGNTATNSGGAIFNAGSLTLNITQSATFSGNSAPSASAGGFLLIDANATASFDIAATATLGIGDAAATNRALDSIASADNSALLAKTGAGALILNANNSAFTGTTTVTAGTLVLGNAGASLGGIVNVASGAAFGGSGSAATVNIAAGGAIMAGDSHNAPSVTSSQTFFAGALNLAAGSSLLFDLHGDGQNDLIIATSFSLAGAATIDINDAITGDYTLLTAASGLTASATDNLATTLAGAALGDRTQAGYSISGNNLVLSIFTVNLAAVAWSGTNGASWQTNHSNWQTSDGRFLNGDSVLFNDTATGARSVAIDAAGVRAVDMLVTTTGTYTFTGGPITTGTAGSTIGSTAAGKLTVNGPGLVILDNAANSFTGGIDIISGTLQGSAATLAVGAGAGIANAGSLIFNQTAPATYTAPVTGAGSLSKTGPGALTLDNAANSYAGGITVNAGSLEITNPASITTLALDTGTLVLHDGGAITGAFTGDGVLNITGGILAINAANPSLAATTNIAPSSSVTLADTAALGSGAINFLAADSTLTINNTAAGVLASSISGPGTLNFNGPAPVTIDHANTAFSGQANIAPGAAVTLTDLSALGDAGAISLDGSLVLQPSTPQAFSLSVAGSGTLDLAGAAISISGSNTVASINILPGSHVTAAAAALGTPDTSLSLDNASLILASGGMSLGHLSMRGASLVAFGPSFGSATIDSLAASGNDATLVFKTNVASGLADTLNITGAVTGAFNIVINNTGGAPSRDTTTIGLINASDTAAASFAILGISNSTSFAGSMNTYRYSLAPSPGALSLNVQRTDNIGPSGGAILVNASGAMPLSWFAELDTIEKRLGDLRLNQRETPGGNLWARLHAQRLNVNGRHTPSPFREDQYGIEAGLDYGAHPASGATFLGVFAGYGQARRDIDGMDASGDSTNLHLGAYFTWMLADGWYLDAVGKFNSFKNKISATSSDGAMRGDYSNSALGASIEGGRRLALGAGWQVTPGVQAALVGITSARYTTSSGMKVAMESTTTRQVRAGALVARKYSTPAGGVFQPYAKLYLAKQWTSNGGVTVDGFSYDGAPQIKGARLDAGLGLNWMLSKDTQLYFDYECAWAKCYTKPWGFTLGVRYAW